MLSNTLRIRILNVETVPRFLSSLNHGLTLFCLKSDAPKYTLPDTVSILKPVNKASSSATLRIKTISKAMKAYLERSKKHEDFLQTKNAEYEIGKQHLANMMGLDAATLTQDDVNRAIAYLLPSGLYEPKARPVMKPPVEMYPKEKAAQFDNNGRPFNTFFYTSYANFYSTLHSLVETFHELDAFEDKMIEKGILNPPPESVLNLSGGDWLTVEEVRSIFLEAISKELYSLLITTLNRLADHPYSFRCKDKIWKYRKEFVDFGSKESIPQLMYDENGRPFIQMVGSKKHAEAKVTVRGNGTGKITINGTDIHYFPTLLAREQIMYPLHFCDMLESVDVEAYVTGPGEQSQANAIRFGISLCLRSFVAPEFVEKMRLAGLLAKDMRRRGRKKPGQKGNRARFTWKKR